MRVAVLGAGAMGSIFGAALVRAGASVVFFDKRKEVVEAIRRDGLVVTGVLGDSALNAAATSDPADLGQADLALVLVDSGATAEVAGIAETHLAGDGFALTLQNGIGNWEALAERLGRERVMAGSTYNSGAGLGPGRTAHTNLGPTIIGELDGTISERGANVVRLFEAGGLPSEATDNIEGYVWSKFVLNCAINPVSAITGLRPGEIARTQPAAALLDRILDEVLSVVAAAGVRLPEADACSQIRDHCWERYNRPSMLQHLQSGRGTEIEALNGALVRRAKMLGIAVPFNEAIVLTVKSLEAGGRSRAVVGLDEPALERAARARPRGDSWGSSG